MAQQAHYKEVGNLLYKTRMDMKLTQEVISGFIGIQTCTYSKWENGEQKPKIASIKKISEVMNLDIKVIKDLYGYKPPSNEFGDLLYKIRKSNKLTQDVVSELLGVSVHTYGMWERNEWKPIPNHLKIISKVFSLDLELLQELISK